MTKAKKKLQALESRLSDDLKNQNIRSCIQEGSKEADQVLTVLLTTYMFVGGFLGCLLDNTIPGTGAERGMDAWQKHVQEVSGNDSVEQSCYDLPFVTKFLKKCKWTRYIPFLPTFRMNND